MTENLERALRLLELPTPEGASDGPAARRNARPIAETLSEVLPADGSVVEIGCGPGIHSAIFAAALSPRPWIPGDITPDSADSIKRWSQLLEPELARPLDFRLLDASLAPEDWPISPDDQVSAFFSANVIHISPWFVAEGLFAAGAHHLPEEDGRLILYGPFARDGAHMSEGNVAFDADLRARDPSWGIRDPERDILPLAEKNSLSLLEVRNMPANNLILVFRKDTR